jgi:hypothetical protein
MRGLGWEWKVLGREWRSCELVAMTYYSEDGWKNNNKECGGDVWVAHLY